MRYLPQFVLRWCFGGADQFVGDSAQEIVATGVSQRPSAAVLVVDDDFETSSVVLFLTLASHIAELHKKKNNCQNELRKMQQHSSTPFESFRSFNFESRQGYLNKLTDFFFNQCFNGLITPIVQSFLNANNIFGCDNSQQIFNGTFSLVN